MRRPAVYLMDEPLGTLDADQQLAMRELIRAEQLASKVTSIYVTHDHEEAMSLADRVVVMAKGNIRQVGSPAEVYDRPADLFVASFVRSPGMNFIRCQVAGRGNGVQLISEQGGVRFDVPIETAKREPSGPSATLGVRCEHVREDERGSIAGRVVTEEYFGSARHRPRRHRARALALAHGRGLVARARRAGETAAPARVVLFDQGAKPKTDL